MPPSPRSSAWPASRRSYLLVMLSLLAAFNHLDRHLLTILLEPIRVEFALTDVQLGLLSGLAFAGIYTVMSVPAALWAVHRGRRNLVTAAAVLWGGMTVACGLAQSFWHFLVARIGVGVGEAGGIVPSQAVISDLYDEHERAAAQGLFFAGINAGVFLAFLVGGLVGHAYGWRVAFIAAGVATVALGLVLRLTVPEPPRAPDRAAPNGAAPNGAALAAAHGSRALLRETARAMWADHAVRHLCVAAALTTTVGYGAVAWLPSYLVRSHGMTIATIGIYLAVVVGLGGAIGTWLGGWLADRLRVRDVRWPLWSVAIAYVIAKPFMIAFYLVDATTLALALFVLPAIFASVFVGPATAVLHERVRPSQRPVASALIGLIVSFIGLGLGPLLVGTLSHWTFAAAGPDSLRYALVVMQIAGLWGALHFWLAGSAVRRVG